MRAANHYGLLQRVDQRPVTDEVQDVIEHLGHLLNVKRDYGSFIEGLGLSISDQMWSSRPMHSLASHIREQIEKFEPRLRNVRIETDWAESHMCPAFTVHGTIGDSTVRLGLSLHTVYCSVLVTQE